MKLTAGSREARRQLHQGELQRAAHHLGRHAQDHVHQGTIQCDQIGRNLAIWLLSHEYLITFLHKIVV
jgi:hypothetical protein